MLKVAEKFRKITGWYSVLGEIAAGFAGVMICLDVIARFVFNSPFTGSYELTQLALGVLTFSVLAYLQTTHRHITVNIVTSRLPHKVSRVLQIITTILCVAACILLAVMIVKQGLLLTSQKSVSPSLLIPYWPFYMFTAFSFILFGIAFLIDAVILVLSLFRKEYEEEVESWGI